MRRDIVSFLALLDSPTKTRLVLYVLGMFLVSAGDLASIGLVLPLVQIMTGASLQGGYLAVVNRVAGFPSRQTLVILVACVLVLIFLLKAVFSLAMNWYMTRFYTRLQVDMSARILDSYLNEPYLAHRKRSFAEISRGVGGSTAAAYSQVLGGILTLCGDTLTVLFLMALVIAVMPGPTLIAGVYFAVTVYTLQRITKRRSTALGTELMHAQLASGQALTDANFGFREIRMHNATDRYTERFRNLSGEAAETGRVLNYFTQLPKYVLEVVVIVGVCLVVVLVSRTAGAQALVGSLALFVAAAVRILPSFVRITATLSMVRGGHAGLKIFLDVIRQNVIEERADSPDTHTLSANPQTLHVDHVHFRYPDGDATVLDDVSIDVAPGTSLALCGASGSGKTTLVDILLGLIQPDEGTILYGTVPVGRELVAWRERIGYVPQDVYIQDSSVLENVAFGEDPETVDISRVRDCLTRTQLLDFIEELPEGLNTRVGERGVRFSGGQRQRLGIARALYRWPEILILDEATSALDNETEHEITETLKRLHGDVTTIIVAHRLSTVRHVDSLVFLESGRVVSTGTFNEVRKQNAAFNHLVELGSLA